MVRGAEKGAAFLHAEKPSEAARRGNMDVFPNPLTMHQTIV